ncbi:MAG: cation transporter [Wenzhouxiangellaceae bacterium]|nr:MAG: cation transporter [Wenzhouxiangellaceae bacterium]
MRSHDASSGVSKRKEGAVRPISLIVGLFGFWLVLTAGLGGWSVMIGLVLASLIGMAAVHLLARPEDRALSAGELFGLAAYGIGMVGLILPAAWQVLRLVMQGRIDIDPVVIEHQTRLRRPLARVALANSITLTPGTHCVDLDEDRLTIHCLETRFAQPIVDGVLEQRLARLLEGQS